MRRAWHWLSRTSAELIFDQVLDDIFGVVLPGMAGGLYEAEMGNVQFFEREIMTSAPERASAPLQEN
jgi:hypothetical protein